LSTGKGERRAGPLFPLVLSTVARDMPINYNFVAGLPITHKFIQFALGL